MWESGDEDFVNPPYKKRKMKKTKKKRRKKKKMKFWRVGISQVTRLSRFKGEPKGLGVFATRPGRFKMTFKGGIYVCKTHMTALQWRYGVQAEDPNSVYVPSDVSIQSTDLCYVWRVNCDTKNPTHECVWHCENTKEYTYGYPYLYPLRSIKTGEEITFNYK